MKKKLLALAVALAVALNGLTACFAEEEAEIIAETTVSEALATEEASEAACDEQPSGDTPNSETEKEPAQEQQSAQTESENGSENESESEAQETDPISETQAFSTVYGKLRSGTKIYENAACTRLMDALAEGATVLCTRQITENGTTVYQVQFACNGSAKSGYVKASSVSLLNEAQSAETAKLQSDVYAGSWPLFEVVLESDGQKEESAEGSADSTSETETTTSESESSAEDTISTTEDEISGENDTEIPTSTDISSENDTEIPTSEPEISTEDINPSTEDEISTETDTEIPTSESETSTEDVSSSTEKENSDENSTEITTSESEISTENTQSSTEDEISGENDTEISTSSDISGENDTEITTSESETAAEDADPSTEDEISSEIEAEIPTSDLENSPENAQSTTEGDISGEIRSSETTLDEKSEEIGDDLTTSDENAEESVPEEEGEIAGEGAEIIEEIPSSEGETAKESSETTEESASKEEAEIIEEQTEIIEGETPTSEGEIIEETAEINEEAAEESASEEENEITGEGAESPEETPTSESEITEESVPDEETEIGEEIPEEEGEITGEEAEIPEETSEIAENTADDPVPSPYLLIEGGNDLRAGKSETLKAYLMPDYTAYSSVSWASSDTAVATVSSAGKVTAKSVSETSQVTISVRSKSDDTLTGEVTITVYPAAKSVQIYQDDTPVSTVSVNLNARTPTAQISARVLPEGAAQSVTYKSSSTAVATVTTDGLITGRKAGTATITVTAADGSGKYAKVKVCVGTPLDVIEISGTQTRLRSGQTLKLTYGYLPEDATIKSVVWSSSNPSAATVSSGKVTAKTVTEETPVTIRADAADGSGTYDTYELIIYPSASKIEISLDGQVSASCPVDFCYDGQTIVLSAAVLPSDAAQSVSWKSSSAKIASVDADTGVVVLHKPGTVTLTATARDGSNKSGKITLYVRYFIKGLTLSGQEALAGGKSTTLKVAYEPSNASYQKVSWAVSNPSAASVSSSGKVTAKKVTEQTLVTVTATALDGSGITGTWELLITPIASSVSILQDAQPVSGTLYLDPCAENTLQLSALVSPAAAWQGVTWSSSSSKTISVDGEGVVTALKNGSATIIAKASDGSGKTAKVTIKAVTAVQSVELSGPAYVGYGKSVTLKADVQPSTASNKSLVWTSSDPDIAKVSSGKVTAGKLSEPASVTITAAAKDGSGQYGEWELTVLPAVTSVRIYDQDSGDDITGTTLLLPIEYDEEGEVCTGLDVMACALPEDASQEFTWSSSASSIATVDENGHVTGLKAGKTTITAKATDGSGKSAKFTVQTHVPVQSIQISGEDRVAYGYSIKLTASCLPANATNRKVIWTSSNPDVLKVSSSGTVTALKSAGSARICATAQDGSCVQAVWNVVITKPVTGMEIRYTEGGVYADFDEESELVTTSLQVAVNDCDLVCLKAYPTPDGTSDSFTFKSSNPAVATVFAMSRAADGYDVYLQLYKKGSAAITATANDGTGKSKSFTLVVSQRVESIDVSGDTYLVSGKKCKLSYSVYPSGASNPGITWSMSNGDEDYSAYASVNTSGYVTAKTVSQATEITVFALAKDGSGIVGTHHMMIYPTEADVPTQDATYRALVVVEPTAVSGGQVLQRSSDYEGMLKVLSMQSFGGKQIAVQGMHGTSAGSVLSAIASLASQTCDADITYFFFLGHGASDGTIQFYDGSYITATTLRRALDELNGRVIVLLGSCYSGYYIKESGGLAGANNASPASFCSAVISAFSAIDSEVTIPLQSGVNLSENIGELRKSKFYVLTACMYNESSWFSYYLDDDGQIEESISFDRFTRGLYRTGGWDQVTGTTTSWTSGTSLTLSQVYTKVSSYVRSFKDAYSSVQVYPSSSGMVIFSH